jgi:hypothetical protein
MSFPLPADHLARVYLQRTGTRGYGYFPAVLAENGVPADWLVGAQGLEPWTR